MPAPDAKPLNVDAFTREPLRLAVSAGRVRLLYEQSLLGLAVTLAVATVAAFVLWFPGNAGQLGAWLAAVAVTTAGRFALLRAYRRASEHHAEAAPAWERRFAVGAGITGVLWGILGSAIDVPSYTHHVFVAFVVGGMVLGALVVLAPSRLAFFAFSMPALVVPAVGFALRGGELYQSMAVLVAILLVATLQMFVSVNRALTQNIERGLVNERLVAEQRTVFDAATVGIGFFREHRLVDCNRELERILGWSRDELTGMSSRDVFASVHGWRTAVSEAFSLARRGLAYRGEVELRRKDGSTVWCDASGRAVIEGEPELGYVVSFADVSARKRGEAALRQSEERLELAVGASQSGLWDWDIAGNVTYFSPRFKEILGYAADTDFRPLFFFSDRLHPEDRERALAAMARAMKSDVHFDCEYRLRRADGTYVWVHGQGRAVRDAGGAATRFAGSIIDVSDRKAVEERLRESEAHFRYLVETANDLVWAVDREGRWTYLSPRATRQIFGCEPEDMLGARLVDTQTPQERDRTAAMLLRVLGDGTASQFETTHRSRKGSEVVLSLNATPLRTPNGAIVGVTGTATEITELKAKEAALSAALAEQELIFDAVSEGLVLLVGRTVQKCNAKFAQMLGYRVDELVGQPTLLFYADPGEWDHLGRQSKAAMTAGGVYEGELLLRRRDGSTFWSDLRGRAIASGPSSIWVVIDISARKEREQRIQHLADHDALTGLLNRRLFEDRLQQSLNLARRNDALVAVMLIDLDGFKAVNDQFGHLMGDYVLRSVARRLRDCVRESDTVARLGGDEFVVLLAGQRSAEDSSVVAEKILSTLTEPIGAGGRRFEIGASIGISIYPRDGTTPEALIKHADAAMYRVKEAGKNRYQFYSP
jgi:diguanylate cyclase (GGDEF)-like protein/PAS domain S-box-containing protein